MKDLNEERILLVQGAVRASSKLGTSRAFLSTTFQLIRLSQHIVNTNRL